MGAMFKPAVKLNAKLRFAVSGPAGSGKTFTLLKLATAFGGKIAYIDTEHGSASKYAHTPACTANCADTTHFSFDVIEPSTFDPRSLVEYIDEAAKAGYAAICIDSLSHYWMGPNGELELVDNTAKQMRNPNSFAAWKTVTPMHNALVDKMLSAPIHILVSMRTKTEWVLDRDGTGKTTPRKIGLQPIMRDGIEFEFDVCGDMDQDNTLVVTKSRCPELSGKSINRPGRETAEKLKVWLGSNPPPSVATAKETVESQQAGSTAVHIAAPSPAATTPASAAPDVPDALIPLFDDLTAPGGVRKVLQHMKELLVKTSPGDGEDIYGRILLANGIKPGASKSMLAVRKAITEMYDMIGRVPKQPEPFVATDDDLPKGLFPEKTKDTPYAD